MQSQIHVENAIEHGLRNRPQSRKLEVNIWDKNDYLDIKVTDWGIGRPAAKKLASQGTQQGVTMLNNLHSIFNKGNSQKIKSWYEDTPFRDHTSGIEYGTIVHILIPKHYCYEPTST